MQRTLLLALFFLVRFFSSAQNADSLNWPRIVFDSAQYCFGAVMQGDVIRHDFHFTNMGKSPLLITSACTNTGAAVADYPREPIAPGKSGVIHYEFMTNGKMGPQSKAVTLQTNMSNPVYVLHITGTVNVRQLYSAEDVLRCEADTFFFGTVTEGTVLEHSFILRNTGKDTLVVIGGSTSCGCDLIEWPKEPIPPGSMVACHYRLDTQGKLSYQHKVAVVSYAPLKQAKTASSHMVYMHVCGNVMLPPPPPDAPVMTFDSTIIWADTIFQGDIIQRDYKFTNTGKTPLIISACSGSGGGVVPDYPREPIKPGGTGIVRLRFYSGGKMGFQDKTVMVTSNASNPTVVLRIQCYVKFKTVDRMQTPAPAPVNANAPVLTFDTAVVSFGKVKKGTVVERQYHFTNTGKQPLVITDAIASDVDGDVVFPKDSLMPGQRGVITVRQGTSHLSGAQYKIVTVHSNGSAAAIILHLNGEVSER